MFMSVKELEQLLKDRQASALHSAKRVPRQSAERTPAQGIRRVRSATAL